MQKDQNDKREGEEDEIKIKETKISMKLEKNYKHFLHKTEKKNQKEVKRNMKKL